MNGKPEDRHRSTRLRRRRISVPLASEVLDLVARRAVAAVDLSQIARPARRFAVATGNIEHVSGLAQPREPAAQRAHQRLALVDAGAPMRGAGRAIAVVEIVGLDAALDQR